MKFILWGWAWEIRYDWPSEHRLDGRLKRCWGRGIVDVDSGGGTLPQSTPSQGTSQGENNG